VAATAGSTSAAVTTRAKLDCLVLRLVGSELDDDRQVIGNERDMPLAVYDIARGAWKALGHRPELLVIRPVPSPTCRLYT
jgi:hypothetical protein